MDRNTRGPYVSSQLFVADVLVMNLFKIQYCTDFVEVIVS